MNHKFKFRHILDINQNPLVTQKGKKKSPVQFSVLTYNILANLYARPKTFSYLKDSSYLKRKYREDLHFKDITELKADIVCLQEVERQAIGNIIDMFKKSMEDYHQRLEFLYQKKGGL